MTNKELIKNLLIIIKGIERRVQVLERQRARPEPKSKAWVPGPFGTMQPP